MCAQAKKLLFEIVSLGFAQIPPTDSKNDVDTITFSVMYPSVGKAAIASVKVFKGAKDLPSQDELASDEFIDQRTVFKEEFCGTSLVTVECVAVDNPSDFEVFLGKLFKTVLSGFLQTWTGGFGSAYVGDSVMALGNGIAGKINPEAKSSIPIGKASFKFNPGDVPAGGTKEYTLSLDVKADVIKTETVPAGDGKNGKTTTKKTVLMRAGQNGLLTLRVTDLS
jgi:hypothetical protein